jgi:hypothetical protein
MVFYMFDKYLWAPNCERRHVGILTAAFQLRPVGKD